MMRALAGQSYEPERSTKALTEPVEFHFHTDERLRTQHQQTQTEETEPRRKVYVKRHNGITVPEEPLLQTQIRAKIKEAMGGGTPPIEPYHSLTEQTVKFHQKTPERFRTRPRDMNVSPKPNTLCVSSKFLNFFSS
jgi:targeting protein for Xklp2